MAPLVSSLQAQVVFQVQKCEEVFKLYVVRLEFTTVTFSAEPKVGFQIVVKAAGTTAQP